MAYYRMWVGGRGWGRVGGGGEWVAKGELKPSIRTPLEQTHRYRHMHTHTYRHTHTDRQTHTHTHTQTHTHAHTHIDISNKSNFKKPGVCLV